MLRGGRVKGRDRVKTTALPASSLFFYVHLLSWLVPTFTLLAVFPSTSPFSLAFLFHSSTHKDGISHSDERLPRESVRDSKQSWPCCDGELNFRSPIRPPYCDLILCFHCVRVRGSPPISSYPERFFFAFVSLRGRNKVTDGGRS